MVNQFRVCAFAGAFMVAGAVMAAATPSFADDVTTPFTDLMTTVTTDVSKGVAEFNPTEILTPKPIEAPAAAPAPKVKKKRHYAKRRMKKMAKS